MVLHPSILCTVSQYYHSKLQLVRSFLQMEPEDTRVPVTDPQWRWKVGSMFGYTSTELDLVGYKDCIGRRWDYGYVEGGVVLRMQGSSETLKAPNLSDLVVFYSENEFSEWIGKISDGK